MNTKIDQLICDLDAVMQGEEPGAIGAGDLAPEVKEKVRAVLRPVVLDCRTCVHNHGIANGYCVRWDCVGGDKHLRQDFVPLWEVK